MNSNGPDPYLRYPGFLCFKSTEAIHYPKRWIRNALIQAALDASTEEVGPFRGDTRDIGYGIEFAFVVRMGGKAVFVALTELPVSTSPPLGIAAIVSLRRSTVMREPVASCAREVWRHKDLQVDVARRLNLLDCVEGSGGQTPLSALVRATNNADCNVGEILNLVAHGYLSLDLAAGITPSTLISVGPRAKPSRSQNTPIRFFEPIEAEAPAWVLHFWRKSPPD
jgi:hypothetical protein